MPPAVDVPIETLYRTRVLIESLAQFAPVSSFLRDTPFSRVNETEADMVSVEFSKGNARLAPFCSPYSKGTAIPRRGGQLSVFSPPWIRPTRMLSADDTFRKGAGTQGADYAARSLVTDTEELDGLISRREEWLASQVIFTGGFIAVDGDTNEPISELSYGTPSRTVVTPFWSDTAANPLNDLKAAFRLVASESGYQPDTVVMGADASDAFESNPNVLQAYDEMRISPGRA
jgi:major capsid protein E